MILWILEHSQTMLLHHLVRCRSLQLRLERTYWSNGRHVFTTGINESCVDPTGSGLGWGSARSFCHTERPKMDLDLQGWDSEVQGLVLEHRAGLGPKKTCTPRWTEILGRWKRNNQIPSRIEDDVCVHVESFGWFIGDAPLWFLDLKIFAYLAQRSATLPPHRHRSEASEASERLGDFGGPWTVHGHIFPPDPEVLVRVPTPQRLQRNPSWAWLVSSRGCRESPWKPYWLMISTGGCTTE